MKVYISWTSVYVNVPYNGVCHVVHTDEDGTPVNFSKETGLPETDPCFFIKSDSVYNLYKLSHDDIMSLNSERELIRSCVGNVNDFDFSFNMDPYHPITGKHISIKHFHPEEKDKIGTFEYKDIVNKHPW